MRNSGKSNENYIPKRLTLSQSLQSPSYYNHPESVGSQLSNITPYVVTNPHGNQQYTSQSNYTVRGLPHGNGASKETSSPFVTNPTRTEETLQVGNKPPLSTYNSSPSVYGLPKYSTQPI